MYSDVIPWVRDTLARLSGAHGDVMIASGYLEEIYEYACAEIGVPHTPVGPDTTMCDIVTVEKAAERCPGVRALSEPILRVSRESGYAAVSRALHAALVEHAAAFLAFASHLSACRQEPAPGSERMVVVSSGADDISLLDRVARASLCVSLAIDDVSAWVADNPGSNSEIQSATVEMYLRYQESTGNDMYVEFAPLYYLA